MSSDFWDEFSGVFAAESGMDRLIQDQEMDGDFYNSVRSVQSADDEPYVEFPAEKKGGIDLPCPSGTRVAFIHNLDSVLTYASVPAEGIEGTVVTVKAAHGKSTYTDQGHAFVKWDDGRFLPVLSKHLQRASGTSRVAKGVNVRVSNLGSLANFFEPSRTASDELVHKATKDLWSFRQDDSGFVIERLFDFSGDPLKV